MVHSSPYNAKSRVHQSQACFLYTNNLGIRNLFDKIKLFEEKYAHAHFPRMTGKYCNGIFFKMAEKLYIKSSKK